MDYIRDIGDNPVVQKIIWIVLVAVGAFVSGLFTKRLISKTPKSKNPTLAARQQTLMHAVNSILKYTIWGAAIIITIAIINGGVTGAFLSIGTLAVVAGFAAQHAVKDFLAGGLLLFEGHYSVGSYVYVNEQIQGTVTDFSLRTTTLLLNNGSHAVIRNDALNQFIVTEEKQETETASEITPL